MLLGLCLRLLIALAVDSSLVANYSTRELVAAIAAGVAQDSLTALLLSTPLWLAGILGPITQRVILALLVTVVLIVSAAELFFWHEFESRLDRLVFHYLAYPQEVAYFLQDQFALTWLAIPLALLVWLCCLGFKPVLVSAHGKSKSWGKSSLLVLALLVTAAALSPLSWPPSHDRTLAQWATNGYLETWRAATVDVAQWHGNYWQPDEPSAPAIPELCPEEREATEARQGIRHVVLIIEESFAGPTWRNPELASRYLPNFTHLQTKGLNFTNMYATGSRTTRGQEALINGYLPLPGIALGQRPNNAKLPSLAKALARQGYFTKFVYAGWPNFSGFKTYWSNIGFAASTSRWDFASASEQGAFETSWGYADEVLFTRLLDEMDALTLNHESVFTATLTLSNHRPYDYPAGRIPFPANERRSEYAMAYADWALGQFLAAAAAKPWFNQTLFVIAADHGAKFEGNAPIPISSYRVPLLFYSPKHLQPQQIDQLGSLISVPNTILALLGMSQDDSFFGPSLLHGCEPLVPVEHNYNVGLLSQSQLTLLHRGGNVSGWQTQATANRYVEISPDLNQAVRTANLFKQAHARFYADTPSASR